MNSLYQPTLTEQSAKLAFSAFFALIKTLLVALVLIVSILIICQSTVAPVSVRLLTTYAMEYAVASFKPYRNFFPEPYLIELDAK